ncbi:hypothetical protein L484_024527 [Morus notabilis]|uniref:Rubisco accumulation factor 1 n=1 Tax=Morus notabilis TaxID=981085 RepID=W9RQR4_9ROSA|nr:rubisco accumulation factor 1.1, chloroplastic [Morus notabilis]EXB93189.1 hypothetical protein L484_024527 [Morus notabilis]
MLSLTSNTLKPFSSFHPSFLLLSKPSLKPISATFSNPFPPPSQQQLYQPFRPPPSPLPNQFRSLDVKSRLEVLADRLGLWFEYAPLIPSLIQEGFTPPSLEEATGISGIEQNHLVVAAQVRDSLIQSNTDPAVVSAFDLGGAELLYEIRLLNAQQRSAAASYIAANGLDARGVQDLARSVRDFPRRRGDKGWESFDYTQPGDCLAFMYFRQSREHKKPSEQRTAALEQALSAAVTERAKGRVLEELNAEGEGEITGEGEIGEEVRVPVVRLKIGEVAEASTVAVLPVCKAGERDKGLEEAPRECWTEGEFGVVVAEKGWARWVVLPAWEPVAGLGKGGVVVSFSDARVLPWRTNRWYKEEAILVVADRDRKEVSVDNGFYLVGGDGGDLKVERGSALKETGVEESLGTVVLVVRPPKDAVDDQLSDEDWE